MTAKEAAFQVLLAAGTPLHYREITKRMPAQRQWTTAGQSHLRLDQHALPLSDAVSASWIMDCIIDRSMRASAMKGRRQLPEQVDGPAGLTRNAVECTSPE